MSGEQKLKDGDEVLFTCESTNSTELLFFTNHRQVYKSHAYDFADSKASVLGDYVASALGMEEGEVPLYMVVTPDYKGWMLFLYENGNAPRSRCPAMRQSRTAASCSRHTAIRQSLPLCALSPRRPNWPSLPQTTACCWSAARSSLKGDPRYRRCQCGDAEKRTPVSPA